MEVITAIVLVAILSIAVIPTLRDFIEAGEDTIVEKDVRLLNEKLDIYLSSEGTIDNSWSTIDVIEELMTPLTEESRQTTTTFGELLPPTTQIETVNSGDGARIVFNQSTDRFQVVTSGTGYRISTGDSEQTTFASLGARDTTSNNLDFAQESPWIWDYEDSPMDARLTDDSAESGAIVNPIRPLEQLGPPEFSYPEPLTAGDFPLGDILSPNPANPPGTVYHYELSEAATLNRFSPIWNNSSNPWTNEDFPFFIKAYARDPSGVLLDSRVVKTTPKYQLDAPTFDFTGQVFNSTMVDNLESVLNQNPNNPTTAIVRYEFNGAPPNSLSLEWTDGYYDFNMTNFPGEIQAQAFAPDERYFDSDVVTATYYYNLVPQFGRQASTSLVDPIGNLYANSEFNIYDILNNRFPIEITEANGVDPSAFEITYRLYTDSATTIPYSGPFQPPVSDWTLFGFANVVYINITPTGSANAPFRAGFTSQFISSYALPLLEPTWVDDTNSSIDSSRLYSAGDEVIQINGLSTNRDDVLTQGIHFSYQTDYPSGSTITTDRYALDLSDGTVVATTANMYTSTGGIQIQRVTTEALVPLDFESQGYFQRQSRSRNKW